MPASAAMMRAPATCCVTRGDGERSPPRRMTKRLICERSITPARAKRKASFRRIAKQRLAPPRGRPISVAALTGCRQRSFADRLRGRETSQPAEPDPVCTGGGIRRFGCPAHQFPFNANEGGADAQEFLVLVRRCSACWGPCARAGQQPTLTVYTYESFTAEWGPGPQVEKAFEAQCGCDLTFVAVADGVALLNRVRLEGDIDQGRRRAWPRHQPDGRRTGERPLRAGRHRHWQPSRCPAAGRTRPSCPSTTAISPSSMIPRR